MLNDTVNDIDRATGGNLCCTLKTRKLIAQYAMDALIDSEVAKEVLMEFEKI